MTKLFRLSLILFLLTVTGCAQAVLKGAVRDNLAVVSAAPVNNLGMINSVVTTGGNDTLFFWYPRVSDENFSSLVETTLKDRGLFGPDGPLQLRVSLDNVSQPFGGFTMTAGIKARYRLVDNMGNARFDKVFTSSHTSTFADNALAVERLRQATEAAAFKNIQAFLTELNFVVLAR